MILTVPGMPGTPGVTAIEVVVSCLWTRTAGIRAGAGVAIGSAQASAAAPARR